MSNINKEARIAELQQRAYNIRQHALWDKYRAKVMLDRP